MEGFVSERKRQLYPDTEVDLLTLQQEFFAKQGKSVPTGKKGERSGPQRLCDETLFDREQSTAPKAKPMRRRKKESLFRKRRRQAREGRVESQTVPVLVLSKDEDDVRDDRILQMDSLRQPSMIERLNQELPSHLALKSDQVRRIQEDNLAVLDGMSEEELKQARDELLASLDPSVIALLTQGHSDSAVDSEEKKEEPISDTPKKEATPMIKSTVLSTDDFQPQKLNSQRSDTVSEVLVDFEGQLVSLESDADGHTLRELAVMVHSSSVIQQRAALNTLNRVIHRLIRGEYAHQCGSDGSLAKMIRREQRVMEDMLPGLQRVSIDAMIWSHMSITLNLPFSIYAAFIRESQKRKNPVISELLLGMLFEFISNVDLKDVSFEDWYLRHFLMEDSLLIEHGKSMKTDDGSTDDDSPLEWDALDIVKSVMDIPSYHSPLCMAVLRVLKSAVKSSNVSLCRFCVATLDILFPLNSSSMLSLMEYEQCIAILMDCIISMSEMSSKEYRREIIPHSMGVLHQMISLLSSQHHTDMDEKYTGNLMRKMEPFLTQVLGSSSVSDLNLYAAMSVLCTQISVFGMSEKMMDIALESVFLDTKHMTVSDAIYVHSHTELIHAFVNRGLISPTHSAISKLVSRLSSVMNDRTTLDQCDAISTSLSIQASILAHSTEICSKLDIAGMIRMEEWAVECADRSDDDQRVIQGLKIRPSNIPSSVSLPSMEYQMRCIVTRNFLQNSDHPKLKSEISNSVLAGFSCSSVASFAGIPESVVHSMSEVICKDWLPETELMIECLRIVKSSVDISSDIRSVIDLHSHACFILDRLIPLRSKQNILINMVIGDIMNEFIFDSNILSQIVLSEECKATSDSHLFAQQLRELFITHLNSQKKPSNSCWMISPLWSVSPVSAEASSLISLITHLTSIPHCYAQSTPISSLTDVIIHISGRMAGMYDSVAQSESVVSMLDSMGRDLYRLFFHHCCKRVTSMDEFCEIKQLDRFNSMMDVLINTDPSIADGLVLKLMLTLIFTVMMHRMSNSDCLCLISFWTQVSSNAALNAVLERNGGMVMRELIENDGTAH